MAQSQNAPQRLPFSGGLDVLLQLLDKSQGVSGGCRLGPHASGTGFRNLFRLCPPGGFLGQLLGVEVEAVAPLVQPTDDSRLSGYGVPSAGVEVGHMADVRTNRAASQPIHHLGSPELAARQTQQAGQRTSHGGIGQRFPAWPGHGDAGQTQLVPYQRGVGIIHTVENRHPVEGGSLLLRFLSYPPNHPPQLLVSIRRDVQPCLPGQQRQSGG